MQSQAAPAALKNMTQENVVLLLAALIFGSCDMYIYIYTYMFCGHVCLQHCSHFYVGSILPSIAIFRASVFEVWQRMQKCFGTQSTV